MTIDRCEKLVYSPPSYISPHDHRIQAILHRQHIQIRLVLDRSMKNLMGWGYAIWMLLIGGICGCPEAPAPLDVRFLATDLHFAVGGQHIVIPAVAIGRPEHSFDLNRRRPKRTLKEQLESDASDVDRPMRSDKLDLSIRQYQHFGHSSASRKICTLLTRKWSQSLCVGAHGGLLRRLPQRFQLLDRSKLELLQYHWTVGKERQYDQVKDMELRPGATEIGCDRESRFCTAMVDVLPGLLAVWTVWSDEHTGMTAQKMANEQGTAIVQFVRRALAPVEDPTLVDEG